MPWGSLGPHMGSHSKAYYGMLMNADPPPAPGNGICVSGAYLTPDQPAYILPAQRMSVSRDNGSTWIFGGTASYARYTIRYKIFDSANNLIENSTANYDAATDIGSRPAGWTVTQLTGPTNYFTPIPQYPGTPDGVGYLRVTWYGMGFGFGEYWAPGDTAYGVAEMMFGSPATLTSNNGSTALVYYSDPGGASGTWTYSFDFTYSANPQVAFWFPLNIQELVFPIRVSIPTRGYKNGLGALAQKISIYKGISSETTGITGELIGVSNTNDMTDGSTVHWYDFNVASL